MVTWGRRPPPPRSSRAAVVALAVLAVVAAVAAEPERAPGPPPSPLEPGSAATIQGLFDLHRSALERSDRVAYESTLDPRSREFLGCMRRLFADGPARAEALAPGRVVALEHVEGTNLVRVRLQQRDGVATHHVRRFLVGPMTAFPWLDLLRSVPAWYISYPDPARAGECAERVEPRSP